MNRRHPATTAFLVLSGFFALGALLQPFTAGLGIFGESFDAHEGLGSALHGITLLALVAALISPSRRRDAPLAVVVFALVTVQLFVVESGTTAVAALHPFLGVSALLLAAWAHLRARAEAPSRAAVPVG